ncbi:MAG: UDP-glucose 4-epimerase GalE [Methanobacteriaceae archaeon]|nr:UDP-glucose 4-epimerase GalE [Methanobacteriaceae archaeon]
MILITGGAGYIGSHINKALNKNNYDTIVLDNLVSGYENTVKWGELIEADLRDSEQLDNIFKSYDIDGVVHCAAFTSVPESIQHPAMYLKNNFQNTLNLIKIMKENNVKNFIFSSTASLYGNPEKMPINEKAPTKPINPYGQSKLLVEKALQRESEQGNLNYISLRYFNASGADPDTEIGEMHNPETHLIPLILDTAIGKQSFISIYGDDYNTPDGTCIRDYIHVNDIAKAHLLAYDYLKEKQESNIFNLGNGNGFSVKEVIDVCRKVTDVTIPTIVKPRRKGDPAKLIADSSKIQEEFNWKPEYDTLEKIVETAWKWHKKYNE